jgi:hypothetical protein
LCVPDTFSEKASSKIMTASDTSNNEFSPIVSDEWDKTDKISQLNKLRKSIGRNVSFVKKSMSRSNSHLSQSSLHSTGSSSHDSFISLDSSITATSDANVMNDSMVMTLRSCMKGSQPGRKDRKFVVRIQKRTKEFKIEPYFIYAADLWYTTAEEKATFLSPQFETPGDRIYAGMYMENYSQAKKQVYPKEWFAMKDPIASKASYSKILMTSYNEIVQGKKNGLAGFEQYSAGVKMRQRVHIQSIVLQIVSSYHDCKAMLNNSSNNAPITTLTSKSIHFEDAQAYSTSSTISECIRNYAKGLTKVDRYWSAVMGLTDYDAACEVYHHDQGPLVTHNEHDDDEDDAIEDLYW